MAVGKRIIIIGAGGRMGAALARAYSQAHDVISYRREHLDITNVDSFQDTLEGINFDTLIYTAGVTNVDYCEDHETEAFLGNGEAPGRLAEICVKKRARMIHVSTDYVFEGNVDMELSEESPAHPISVYGASKLAGEKAVLYADPTALVIRVSWLFGLDRPSFPDMILKRALEFDKVEAIADKVSCPTYSEDLALWIEPMLADTRYSGLLHLSNSGATSWQNYGQAALDIAAELGLPLKARTVDGLSRSDFPAFKAKRPEFTAFDTAKFQSLSGIVPRPWKEALRDYLKAKYL